MKTITIAPKQQKNTYTITIGTDILAEIQNIFSLKNYSKIIILTDTNLEKFWLSTLSRALPKDHETIIINPGEKEKNITTVQTIWKQLFSFGCDRKSLIINLGGGVICDMGGFAASTYMRGIDCINIPTTLLAQVDASIGGKTGFDYIGIKNLIGSFTQPRAVIIDTKTLQTLPKRIFIEGFAEIIKHGLIQDRAYFDFVTKKLPTEYTLEELQTIIARSCEIKAQIVNEDEYESGKRKLVNFGHTIGHAVESLSLETANPLLHGEAISIGMIAEAKLSAMMGYITANDVSAIQEKLSRAGLPTTMPNMNQKQLFEKIAMDKKNNYGKIKWTLLKHIGEAIYDIEIPTNYIKSLFSIS
jgi:3-dehydroquinate synthase